MSTMKVATRGEIPSGTCKSVELGDKTIAIYNVDGDFYATTNTCAHQGGPLGDGLLDGKIVTCPWHAWQFDVCTGESVFDPGVKIDCFTVRLEGDDIFIEVPVD